MFKRALLVLLLSRQLSQKMVRADSGVRIAGMLHSESGTSLVDLLLDEVIGSPRSIQSEHCNCLHRCRIASGSVFTLLCRPQHPCDWHTQSPPMEGMLASRQARSARPVEPVLSQLPCMVPLCHRRSMSQHNDRQKA